MNTAAELLSLQVSSGKTPGISYAFFDAENIRFSYCGGKSDVLNCTPVDGDTMFNGFSVTKTFTALAVLQLEERGKLKLDDPVRKYLPDFPYGDIATIQHLLNHTAGIPNPIPLKWIHLIEEHDTFDSLSYFAPVFARHHKTRSEPGMKFAYSNLGYILLGRLIEKVSGERYEDYITDHILNDVADPRQLSFTIDPALHAKGYQKVRSMMNLMLGFFIDKKKYMGPAEDGWKPFKPTYINGAAYGGLIVTTAGLVKYGQALLQPGRAISENSKAKLFTENLRPDGKATGMCLSWFTDTLKGLRYYAHPGGGGGFYVELRLYPELRCGSTVIFNRSGMSNERFLDGPDEVFIGS